MNSYKFLNVPRVTWGLRAICFSCITLALPREKTNTPLSQGGFFSARYLFEKLRTANAERAQETGGPQARQLQDRTVHGGHHGTMLQRQNRPADTAHVRLCEHGLRHAQPVEMFLQS